MMDLEAKELFKQLDELEVKVRHVRTPGGARVYKVPIGSVIEGKHPLMPVAKAKPLKVTMEHHGDGQVSVHQEMGTQRISQLHPDLATADDHVDEILDHHTRIARVHHDVDGQEFSVAHAGDVKMGTKKIGTVGSRTRGKIPATDLSGTVSRHEGIADALQALQWQNSAPAVKKPVSKPAVRPKKVVVRNPVQDKPGLVLSHGGLSAGSTLDDIDLNRRGTQQGRRGNYGGFYLGDQEGRSAEWVRNYASTRNGVIHHFHLKNTAVVKDASEIFPGRNDIDRLTPEDRQAALAKGVDVLRGKDTLGRTQYVLLNKDAVKKVEEVNVNNPVQVAENKPRQVGQQHTNIGDLVSPYDKEGMAKLSDGEIQKRISSMPESAPGHKLWVAELHRRVAQRANESEIKPTRPMPKVAGELPRPPIGKRVYEFTAPDGSKFERNTARTYSHAVLVTSNDATEARGLSGTAYMGATSKAGTTHLMSVHSRFDLAQKEVQKWSDFGYHTHIVEPSRSRHYDDATTTVHTPGKPITFLHSDDAIASRVAETNKKKASAARVQASHDAIKDEILSTRKMKTAPPLTHPEETYESTPTNLSTMLYAIHNAGKPKSNGDYEDDSPVMIGSTPIKPSDAEPAWDTLSRVRHQPRAAKQLHELPLEKVVPTLLRMRKRQQEIDAMQRRF